MTLAEIAIVLSFVGMASTLFVGTLCHVDLEHNSLLRQEATLLWWYILGSLMLWGATMVAMGHALYAASLTGI